MDLENKIKNHLKNASSLEGLDVNDLWNDIEKGLEEKKTKKKPVFFRRHHLLGGLILLFITGGISWSLFFSNFNILGNYQLITNKIKTNQNSKSSPTNKEIALIDKVLPKEEPLIAPSPNKNNQNSKNSSANKNIALIDKVLPKEEPLIAPSPNKNNQNSKNSSANKEIPLLDKVLTKEEPLIAPSPNKNNQNSKNSSANKEIPLLDKVLTKEEPLIAPYTNKNNQNSESSPANKESPLIDKGLPKEEPLIAPYTNKNNQNSESSPANKDIALIDKVLPKEEPLIVPYTNKNNQNSESSPANKDIALIDNTNWNKYSAKSSKKIKTLNLQDLSIQLPLNLEQKHIDPELEDLFSLNNMGNKTKFSIGAFVGLHTTKNIFFTPPTSDNISDLLNKAYQYDLGSSIGLEVDFCFYKSLFVLTGLEYSQSMSEFNLTQSWGITRSNPNSPTGYSNATATRVVKHHNKMSYYAIPLFLGIKKSTAKLEWGISLGVHLNFTQLQTGKTLNQYDNLVVLDAGTTALPVSRFFISYSCRPFINYKINKNVTIQLRVDGRYQNYGFSELYNLNYAAIYMGLSIGAQFKF